MHLAPDKELQVLHVVRFTGVVVRNAPTDLTNEDMRSESDAKKGSETYDEPCLGCGVLECGFEGLSANVVPVSGNVSTWAPATSRENLRDTHVNRTFVLKHLACAGRLVVESHISTKTGRIRDLLVGPCACDNLQSGRFRELYHYSTDAMLIGGRNHTVARVLTLQLRLQCERIDTPIRNEHVWYPRASLPDAAEMKTTSPYISRVNETRRR